MYKIFLGGLNEYAMFGLNKPEAGPNPSALGHLETSLTFCGALFCIAQHPYLPSFYINIAEDYKDVPSS